MNRRLLIPALLIVIGAAAVVSLMMSDREAPNHVATANQSASPSASSGNAAVQGARPIREDIALPDPVAPGFTAEDQEDDPSQALVAGLQRQMVALFADAIDGTGPDPEESAALFEQLLLRADIGSSSVGANGLLTVKLTSPVPGTQMELWILPGASGSSDDIRATIVVDCDNDEEIRPYLGKDTADMHLFVEGKSGAITKANVFAQTLPPYSGEAHKYFERFGADGCRTGSVLFGTGADATQKALMVSAGYDEQGVQFWRQRWVDEPPQHAFVPAHFESIMGTITSLRQRVAAQSPGK
jgi:hypothetical protein